MPAIIVRDLKKTYKQPVRKPGFKSALASLFRPEVRLTEAVRGISFALQEGEVVGFVGPNGAGKTTTMKMLAGILHPDGGEIQVLGFTPWERKNAFRKQMSLVMGQRNQLWWDLPVGESFELNRIIYAIPKDEFRRRLRALTDVLEIGDLLEVQSRKLSLGQRMRCELVASLLHEPHVLFLDEPTVGLDVVSQKRIREFLKTYSEEKKTTILLTSHNMDDIEEVCSRLIIINEGSLVYDGGIAELMKRFVAQKKVIVRYRTLPDKEFSVEPARVGETIQQALAAGDVDDISIMEPKIEDVIRQIFSTGRS